MSPLADDLRSVLAEMRADCACVVGGPHHGQCKNCQRADRLTALLAEGGGEAVAWRYRDDVRPGLPWFVTDDEEKISRFRAEGGYEIVPLGPITTPPPQARGDMVLVPRELPSSVIIDGDRVQPPIGYGNSWREYYEKWWSNILSSLAAAPAEGSGESEHVRKLVGKLDRWRKRMSHNESYFGEPAGLVKSVVEELAHAVDPIYPPLPGPVDPLAGVVIHTGPAIPYTPPPASQSADFPCENESEGPNAKCVEPCGYCFGTSPASQSAPSAGSGELDTAAIEAGHINFNSMCQCADAWLAVVSALHEVAPSWGNNSLTGIEAATTAIRRLATAGQGVE